MDSSYAISTGNRKLNSWFVLPSISYKLIADGRLDFDISYGLFISKAYFDKQLLVRPKKEQFNDNTLKGNDIVKKNDHIFPINMLRLNVNLHPDQYSRDRSIFFRATMFLGHGQNNLSLQLGYSTPITKLF